MKQILTMVLVLIGLQSKAQEISGRVLNESKEVASGVMVVAYRGGINIGQDTTDIDGIYMVKPLESGEYDVLFLYPGYDSILVQKVIVIPGERTTQNMILIKQSEKRVEKILSYKKPIVSHCDWHNVSLTRQNPTSYNFTRDDLSHIPWHIN